VSSLPYPLSFSFRNFTSVLLPLAPLEKPPPHPPALLSLPLVFCRELLYFSRKTLSARQFYQGWKIAVFSPPPLRRIFFFFSLLWHRPRLHIFGCSLISPPVLGPAGLELSVAFPLLSLSGSQLRLFLLAPDRFNLALFRSIYAFAIRLEEKFFSRDPSETLLFACFPPCF